VKVAGGNNSKAGRRARQQLLSLTLLGGQPEARACGHHLRQQLHVLGALRLAPQALRLASQRRHLASLRLDDRLQCRRLLRHLGFEPGAEGCSRAHSWAHSWAQLTATWAAASAAPRCAFKCSVSLQPPSTASVAGRKQAVSSSGLLQEWELSMSHKRCTSASDTSPITSRAFAHLPISAAATLLTFSSTSGVEGTAEGYGWACCCWDG
jgi:hypothetical protein